MAPRASSARPILCAVLDGAALGPDPGVTAATLFVAGVDWIQLRDRALDDRTAHRLAGTLVAAARSAEARADGFARSVIVNRRVDVAWASGADGVQLGFDALAPDEARALLGPDARIGVSLHSLDEVHAAAEGSATHAQLAPIWDPRSKPASRPPLGLETLARACSVELPLIAQGGIDAERAAEAIEAGAAGVAVTGVIQDSVDPAPAVRGLRDALDGARGR